MKRLLIAAVGVAFWLGGRPAAPAQEQDLILSVRRNFGYSAGSQIQGSFRMEIVNPPADLVSVVFSLDDTVVGTVSAPPYRLDFDTDDYPLGWHALSATGQTADGRTLTTAKRRFEFVSAEAGWQVVGGIALPMLALIGGVMVITFLIPLATAALGRRSAVPLGAERSFGLLGGAICPSCQRPFAIHFWSLNLAFQRFDHCDHCGRWSLVRRATPAQLAEAIAAEARHARPEAALAQLSPEEELRRRLDDSRFTD